MRIAAHALAALTALLPTLPALAGDRGITVLDPYLQSANPMTAAAFMTLVNRGSATDRLVDVRSDAARRVELHTHLEAADGVMRMRPIADGIAIPAGASHAFERGGDHVMFLGLTAALAEGDSVALTLVFEVAGELTIAVPVTPSR